MASYHKVDSIREYNERMQREADAAQAQIDNVDMALGCIIELADEVYAEPVRDDVAILKGCVMELVEMIAPLFEE